MPSTYPSTGFSIATVQTQATNDEITLYTEIRLASLLNDPDSFGSVYKDEIVHSRSKFSNRINTPGRTTIFASLDSGQDLEEEEQGLLQVLPDTLVPADSRRLSPWLGTITALAPSLLRGPWEQTYPSKVTEALEQSDIEVWALVGMWVRPEHRGKGIGTALAQRALEEVKRLADSSKAAVKIDRLVLLEVYEHNFGAIKLYERAGFQMFVYPSNVDDPGKRRWMAYKILAAELST
ncbi:hypothetical protein CPB83DRAFT_856423 [Crepidotus variabilis]|uniref:N-acetyltransferase domain-containing protein n=1 Tax=Crepidotus variabilis TaxID=179855 RepID=A0A9P6JP86_9AGAR|nr:hypothetical protein CPB83DRAFT_856423 [Crepidotus variabilis]